MASPPSSPISGVTPSWRACPPPISPARFAGRRASLKALLTDQRIIAGIGSIYADEICFRARLRPDRAGGSLSPAEVAALARAARSVLRKPRSSRAGRRCATCAIATSPAASGSYQAHHAVYDRAGEPCPRCGQPVVRLKIGARSAYCCESCQL